ncbi:MAG: hypothetical protein GTO02_19030, partial [Candidatus Dadabacteria bacterium]|nr:hypothetical protein [Candidatus Dadabacteria bacterium]
MVFRNLSNSIGNFYNGFQKGFTNVVDPARKVIRSGISIGNHIDTLLKSAQHIPIVGDIVSDITASPEYHEFRGLLDSGSDLLDRAERYGSLIDRGVQFGIEKLGELEGSKLDVALEGIKSDVETVR